MAEPTATVYSFYTPEVEKVVLEAIAALNFGRRDFETIHEILRQNFDPGLDDLHLPLLAKYERFARSEGIIGLDTFQNQYFTNGSSEGIFHLLAEAKVFDNPVYQLEGEYQGYQQYADAIGLDIHTVDLDDLIANRPRGTVVLSNPASKDGNILDPNVLTTILRRHEVILDLAYMGMTQKPLNLDLTQPGIVAVVGSLSKPFGLYYYRIGFCYSRDPVPSLYGNKWFKNALSIRIGEAVLDHFAVPDKMDSFKSRYFAWQGDTIDQVEWYVHAPTGWVKPSDVWLLAHAAVPTETWGGPGHQAFKRTEDTLRFCLTPYYQESAR